MADSALREKLEAKIKENQSKGMGVGATAGTGPINRPGNQEKKEESSVFKSTDFLIRNNVMVWRDMMLQLSNVSAVEARHRAENRQKKEPLPITGEVSFENFLNENPLYYGILVVMVVSFLGGFGNGAWFFLAFVMLILFFSGFGRYSQLKNQPQYTYTNEIIDHYYVRIIMNSGNRYDFEVRSKAFRDRMITIIYDIISEKDVKHENVYYNPVTNEYKTNVKINGSQFIIGDVTDSQVVNSSGVNSSVDMTQNKVEDVDVGTQGTFVVGDNNKVKTQNTAEMETIR